MDLRAAGRRGSPALVGGQLGDDDLQAAFVRITATHRRTHITLALQGANRRPHQTQTAGSRGQRPRR